MPLAAGTRLGPYEILSALGTGGMGEVYRARDERLKREVAVKVLPGAFAEDHERLNRFEKEAQAASALNHPNILSVYDFGTHDGAPYIVSELLDGDSLRNHLAGSALTPRRAVAYALQIATGLAAAHGKGIVHRDLKPENVFVTNDGRVKILDFGLAKLVPPNVSSAGAIDVTMPGTEPGMVLGTVGYMSPEQVRGKPADARSDIFAFGVIFYEMLAGRRAFHGDSAAETMSAILTKDPPDLSEAGDKVPEALTRIVRHCVEKNPEARFHSASDIAFDLEALSGTAGAAVAASAPAWRLRALAMTTLAAVAALVFGLWWGSHATTDSPPPIPVRSALLLPEGLTFGSMAISPDGAQLTVSGLDASGGRRLWIRALDSFEFRALPGTEGGDLPFWSPDGRWLGFFASGKLKKIDTSGGPAIAITNSTGVGACWGGGGDILFSEATGPVLRVPASGGKPVPVTKLDQARRVTSHRYPQFLPDGRHFLYLAMNLQGSSEDEANQIRVASIDSKEDRAVMRGYSRTIYVAGHLLYARAATYAGPLMAQPFDVEHLATHGEPMTIADGVSAYGDYYLFSNFAASENGTLVYDSQQLVSRLVWLDRVGRQVGEFGEPAVFYAPRISPDGERVAYTALDASMNKMQIWVGDLSRGVRMRLTNGPSENVLPVWSPDGGRIAFQNDRKHQGDVYVKSSRGGGSEEALHDATDFSYPDDWSLDGTYIIYFSYWSDSSGNRIPTIRVLPLSGDRQSIEFARGTPITNLMGGSRFSPNGRWVAYMSDESGRPEVYLSSFPGRDTTLQISSAGGVLPTWRRDGRELFYLTPNGMMMSVEIRPGNTLWAGSPKPLFQARPPSTFGTPALYDVTPDGQRFLFVMPVVRGSSVPLNLVLNWMAELGKEK